MQLLYMILYLCAGICFGLAAGRAVWHKFDFLAFGLLLWVGVEFIKQVQKFS